MIKNEFAIKEKENGKKILGVNTTDERGYENFIGYIDIKDESTVEKIRNAMLELKIKYNV